MYNFSGSIFRLVSDCGLFFLLGILCILFQKPWKNGFKFKKYGFGLGVILLAICLAFVYGFSLLFPKVTSYTGDFIRCNRSPRMSFGTYEYVFWNGEGKKQTFYLDIFSQKKIFTSDFETGKEYIVYYDSNNIIVGVQETDKTDKDKTGDGSMS